MDLDDKRPQPKTEKNMQSVSKVYFFIYLTLTSTAPCSSQRVPLSPEIKRAFAAEAKPSDDADRQARKLLAAGNLSAAETAGRHAVAPSPRITGIPTNSLAVPLLAESYLREGKNRETLKTFLPQLPHVT